MHDQGGSYIIRQIGDNFILSAVVGNTFNHVIKICLHGIPDYNMNIVKPLQCLFQYRRQASVQLKGNNSFSQHCRSLGDDPQPRTNLNHHIILLHRGRRNYFIYYIGICQKVLSHTFTAAEIVFFHQYFYCRRSS